MNSHPSAVLYGTISYQSYRVYGLEGKFCTLPVNPCASLRANQCFTRAGKKHVHADRRRFPLSHVFSNLSPVFSWWREPGCHTQSRRQALA